MRRPVRRLAVEMRTRRDVKSVMGKGRCQLADHILEALGDIVRIASVAQALLVLSSAFGFTADLTAMNLFSVSNQNGAPSERASVVISQPASVASQ